MLAQTSSMRRSHYLAALGLIVATLLIVGPVAPPANAAPPAPATPNGSIDWDIGGPKIISNGARSVFPWVVVDSNNIAHVVYITVDGGIWYTDNAGGSFNVAGKLLDQGTATSAVPSAMIAIGPGNILHVVYALIGKDNQIYYIRSGDGGKTWTSRQQISDGAPSTSPRVAIDQGNNAHIVWIDVRCGPSRYNASYRVRRADGSLSGISKPSDECSVYQTLAQISIADGQPQVIFRRGDATNSEIYYTRLEGGAWVGATKISLSSGIGSFNPALASDGGNNLFVAWEEASSGHDVLFRASSDGGHSWQPIDLISYTPSFAGYPFVSWSAATRRAYIVWSDSTGSNDGLEEIWKREFDPASQQTTAAERITQFNGHSMWGAIAVGSRSAHLVWHDNMQASYQIWDWAGQVLGAQPGCDINADTTVDANVAVSNPHLHGLAPNYTGKAGANDGDPRFTRDQTYYLHIGDAVDCSGLKAFSVRGGGPTGSLLNSSYENYVRLPAGASPERNITVDITDTVDNHDTFTRSLIYDPDPPTLVTTDSPTITVPLSTTTIIVPLSFSNIGVSDPLYGQFAGLPAGKQFWGVWVANSATNVSADDISLSYFPVQISAPARSFIITWSLFGGLTPAQQQGDHDYYVYVKFLDGAGNPTSSAIQARKVHLAASFSKPTLYVPLVRKN